MEKRVVSIDFLTKKYYNAGLRKPLIMKRMLPILIITTFLVLAVFAGSAIFYWHLNNSIKSQDTSPVSTNSNEHKKPNFNFLQKVISKMQIFNPLAIETMRKKEYPGSEITIENELPPGENYKSYIASYKSDGLKIFALLTIPDGQKPENGWPVIVFNHGYVPPKNYSIINDYEDYTDVFSRNGYIVFKPDYRGNGKSEGKPTQSYISADYVTDDLNAIESIRRYKYADANKIGIYGHSMGGNITLHDLVVTRDIKAAVICSGVVGSYTDILDWWNNKIKQPGGLKSNDDKFTNEAIKKIVAIVGTPESNPDFWNAVDPSNYIKDINTPIQVDVGTKDETVPYTFSRNFADRLNKAGKRVEYYIYEGEDHNFEGENFHLAMQRSVEFFDRHLKY